MISRSFSTISRFRLSVSIRHASAISLYLTSYSALHWHDMLGTGVSSDLCVSVWICQLCREYAQPQLEIRSYSAVSGRHHDKPGRPNLLRKGQARIIITDQVSVQRLGDRKRRDLPQPGHGGPGLSPDHADRHKVILLTRLLSEDPGGGKEPPGQISPPSRLSLPGRRRRAVLPQ